MDRFGPVSRQFGDRWALAGRGPSDQDDSDIMEPFENSLAEKVNAFASVVGAEAHALYFEVLFALGL